MGKLYKGKFDSSVDPRDLALYLPADAARYLGVHPVTLSTWLFGRSYPTTGGEKYFAPLISPADPDNKLLSFFNLAEIHVLAATRYEHKVSFWLATMIVALRKCPPVSGWEEQVSETYTRLKKKQSQRIAQDVASATAALEFLLEEDEPLES